MSTSDLAKIAMFTNNSKPRMETPWFHLEMNALDLADALTRGKPASMLTYTNDLDVQSSADFVGRNLPMNMRCYKKNVLVSYDMERLNVLSEELYKGAKDHVRMGTLLGYPESAVKAFSDPTYNINFVTSDGYFAKKKFDDKLFFAGFHWPSVDDEASLAIGGRRMELFTKVFGKDACDRFANEYRKQLVDRNPILDEYIPARPGYAKPNVWV